MIRGWLPVAYEHDGGPVGNMSQCRRCRALVTLRQRKTGTDAHGHDNYAGQWVDYNPKTRTYSTCPPMR